MPDDGERDGIGGEPDAGPMVVPHAPVGRKDKEDAIVIGSVNDVLVRFGSKLRTLMRQLAKVEGVHDVERI